MKTIGNYNLKPFTGPYLKVFRKDDSELKNVLIRKLSEHFTYEFITFNNTMDVGPILMDDIKTLLLCIEHEDINN